MEVKRKKHWTESTHSENQNIVPFSAPHATNYDSIVTEEVNHFLMPKIAIDDPKEELKLDNPSVHSGVDIYPAYQSPVTDFLAPDVKKDEAELSLVKGGSKEFSFLDSFDDSSKLAQVIPLSYVLNKPSAEKKVSQDFPVLTKEDTAPPKVEKSSDSSFNLKLPSLTTLYPLATPNLEKKMIEKLDEINSPVLTDEFKFELTTPSPVSNKVAFLQPLTSVKESELTKPYYYTGIPTLTEIIQDTTMKKEAPEISTIILDEPTENKFVPTGKPEMDEGKNEFTDRYHVLIEEALYFDAQNNKDAAMNSLVEAGKMIENIKVGFYLKIAMQSYKNAITSNSLPSIINQFYIIEKEKVMKEYAQKKQDIAAFNAQKIIPVDSLHSDLLEIVNVKPAAIESLTEIITVEYVDSETNPTSPWEEGYVLFTSPEGELVAFKPEQNIEDNETPVKVIERAEEDIKLKPEQSIEDNKTPVKVVEHDEEDIGFNSEQVLADGTDVVSFKDAFITSQEDVQQELKSDAADLQAFVEEVEKEPLEEVVSEPVVLTVEKNEPPVVFAAFEDPVEHNPSEGLLSDPELSPVAENIQQQIENTDVQEPMTFAEILKNPAKYDAVGFEEAAPQILEEPDFLKFNVEIKKSSIEDEFSDEETKNQFMGAFGDIFKPKKEAEMPNIVIPQNRKHTVWVNWMSTE